MKQSSSKRLLTTNRPTLLCTIAIGTLIGGVALSVGLDRISELTDAEYRSQQSAIAHISELSREIDELLAVVGRRGFQSNDSIQMARESERTLVRSLETNALQVSAPYVAAHANLSLAKVQLLQGERGAAEASLRTAISQFEDAQRPTGVAESQLVLGTLLYQLGRHNEALQAFDAIVRESQLATAATTVYGLAMRNWLVALGQEAPSNNNQVADILQNLEAASRRDPLSPASELLIDLRVLLANTHLRDGDSEQTRELLEAAAVKCHVLTSATQKSHFPHGVADQRKYERAFQTLQRSIDFAPDLKAERTTLAWNWLYDPPTESISAEPPHPLRMSAEFEHQSGLVLPWLNYAWLRPCIRNVVTAAWQKIPITLVVSDELDYYQASEMLLELNIPPNRIQICIASIESPWLRDMGPIATQSSVGEQTYWVDACNSLFTQSIRPQLDALPRLLQRRYDVLRVPSSLMLEGGAVLSNGNGITFVSDSVERMNLEAGFDSRRFHKELKRITGATQVVALEPLNNEPTGHLDLFMTVVSEDTVIVAKYEDPTHENAIILDRNAQRLATVQHNGKPLRVVRIPMPASLAQTESEDHFYSYTNVIYANGLLLVPSWPSIAKETEAQVVAAYQSLLPDCQISLIDCSELIGRGGALHCLASNLGNAVSNATPEVKARETAHVALSY